MDQKIKEILDKELNHKLWLISFALILGIVGAVLVTIINWKIALGLFLMLWANNISNKVKF